MLDRVGETHTTNEGYQVKIIEYYGVEGCSIQFEDGTILKNLRYSHIKNGSISNPKHPSVFGVGYLGIGKYVSTFNSKHTKAYNTWSGMFTRCYSEKYQKKKPSYIGCSVVKDWHNFQVFAKWFEENYVDGWYLDKDILFKGNKIYSSETCCFVPNDINICFAKSNSARGSYLIGVSKFGNKFQAQISKKGIRSRVGIFSTELEAFNAYKIEKENYIKELALEYKDKITKNLYHTLLSYKVETTD